MRCLVVSHDLTGVVMRRPALAALALLVLAGCAAQPAAPEPFTVPTESSTAPTVVELTPQEVELFGPRVELPGGLLLKQFGKVAQWGQDTDVRKWGVRVVLDEVRIDPECDEFVTAPERGHRLVLSLRVETSELYEPTIDDGPHYYRWSVTGPDGVSESAGSIGAQCNVSNELPFDMRPAAQYRGEVVIDTRYTSGQLVLDNLFAWDFPAGGSA